MTSTDIATVHQFVDNSIGFLEQVDMRRVPHRTMPLEMRDDTREAQDDWVPWKPIASTVSVNDIKELEQKMHLRYPDLYIEFLQYKHFYELLPVHDITFFEHAIDSWKVKLLDSYYKSWVLSKLIERGYICFANYSDWGIVCFDTNGQNRDDNDCQVIMIDHDLLFADDSSTPKEVLYTSFAEMMRTLLKDQKSPVGHDENQ